MVLAVLIILAVIGPISCFYSKLTFLNKRSMQLHPHMVNSLQDPHDVGVVLLAGGKGTRMRSTVPKQFSKDTRETCFSFGVSMFFYPWKMLLRISL